MGKMVLQQPQRIAITSKRDMMAFAEVTIDKRDATSSVSESPIEWRNEDVHQQTTIISIPSRRRGSAIAFICSGLIFSRSGTGVARSMT